MGKDKAWEYCEEHGLNEKPGETAREKEQRSTRKESAMQVLQEIEPDDYTDAEDREESAGASLVISTSIVEPDYQRGRKIVKSAQEGHEAVHGTQEEKKERWQVMLDTCLEVYKEHPRWDLGDIRKEAAKRLQAKYPEDSGYSFHTIEKHTRPLKSEIAKLK